MFVIKVTHKLQHDKNLYFILALCGCREIMIELKFMKRDEGNNDLHKMGIF